MSGKLLVNRLSNFLNREVTVAVGEELITGTLTAVNMEFITVVESTDNYERESRTRIYRKAPGRYMPLETT